MGYNRSATLPYNLCYMGAAENEGLATGCDVTAACAAHGTHSAAVKRKRRRRTSVVLNVTEWTMWWGAGREWVSRHTISSHLHTTALQRVYQ